MSEEMTICTKVGIFWSVGGVVIGDAVHLLNAEEYGDALQYGGHYEYLEKLKPATEAERKFKSHAYVYYPRGRMVCFPKRQTARLYVDRCMDNDVRNAAMNFFANEETAIEVELDDHYRCAGCNRDYLD